MLSLSDKLIYTQEQERSRIARELHDGLGQQIAALSISVASLKRQIPESDAEGRERVLRLQQRIAAISDLARLASGGARSGRHRARSTLLLQAVFGE